MSIKLVDGGDYYTRNGNRVRVTSSGLPDGDYPFSDSSGSSLTAAGRYWAHEEESEYDIVEVAARLPLPTPAAEVDPNGVAANAPGSKLDAGKPRPALVLGEFSRALSAVVDIGTFGASKYTPRGWVSVPNGAERYADAAGRHQLKAWAGEVWDNGPGGTGGRHKAQVIWNLLAELELELREEGNGRVS